MDVEAVRAALSAPVLAPPIARVLGLPPHAVEAALALLAEGAQPAFIAVHRADRVDGLPVRDLERIQAAAVRAVAFEFQRETLRQELRDRHRAEPVLDEMVRAAEHPLDLEDVRVLLRKRKRGPAAKARGLGVGPLADALFRVGTWGALSDPQILDLRRGQRSHARRRGAAATPQNEVSESVGDDPAHGPAEATEVSDSAGDSDAEVSASGEATEGAHLQDAHLQDADLEGAHVEDVEGSDASVLSDSEPASDSDESSEPASDSDESSEPESESDESDESDASADDGSTAADDADEADETSASASPPDPFAWAESRVGEGLPTAQDVLAHARTICAERIAEWPPLRLALRHAVLEHGRIVAHGRAHGHGHETDDEKKDEKKDKAARFTKLANKPEGCSQISSPTLLAIHRGERENVLSIEVEVPDGLVDEIGRDVLQIAPGPAGDEVANALAEAWQFSLGRAVRTGVRRSLKERSDRDAIGAYAEALRPLLLAPALGPVRVLGIDPGFAPGCRVVVLDVDATVIEHDTVFPLQPKLQAPQAKARLGELITQNGIAAVAIADAGGGRDLERLVREVIAATEGFEQIPVVMIDSEMVALLAAARPTKDELGEEAPLRRAVAVGRRLQDPLAELVKIDPRKLGMGQYQHEVDQEELRATLDQVVSSCVCDVGVDVNRAGIDVLSRVPGMSHAISRALLSFRTTHDTIATRSQLFDVPGFAGKTFEQSAGFLRIDGGEQPLDGTAIHPERYPLITQIARDLGVTVPDLLGHPEHVDRIDSERYMGNPSVSGEPLGPRVMLGILDQLRTPGRDPRPPFVSIAFDPQLRSFADLTVGMELDGVITRIASFGAFVDVGLSHEGLAHISELSHTFTSSPADVVHIGQVVKGRVIEIDAERKRFSLSLRALLPKPERTERPAEPSRRKPAREGEGAGRRDDRPRSDGRGESDPRRGGGERPGGGGGRGGGPGRGSGGGGRGRDQGDRREAPERTLNFNLDLSALMDRVSKG